MGLFDFFTRSEPIVKQTVSRSLTVTKEETVPSALSQENVTEKTTLRATDSVSLQRCLKLKKQAPDAEAVFYCPIMKAKVFCHSILIDKLGDLTKFIISSLYYGNSFEKIDELTQMGSTTLKEEIDYLIRGGLIDEEGYALTELGNEYGKLLEVFDSLSDGIEMAYNLFSELFEPIEEDHYIDEPDQELILDGHFIPILARNDNYANSLKIAREKIVFDTPFCWDIRSSLYATVKIDRDKPQYKTVYIRNFDRGYAYESGKCVKIAIPFDRITYRPRYTWIDPYREILSQVSLIEKKDEDLLSDKAKLLTVAAQEEDNAILITKEINTISGTISRVGDNLVELSDIGSAFVLDRQPVELILDDDSCDGLYLEEVKREQLFRIRYYPYSQMEV